MRGKYSEFNPPRACHSHSHGGSSASLRTQHRDFTYAPTRFFFSSFFLFFPFFFFLPPFLFLFFSFPNPTFPPAPGLTTSCVIKRARGRADAESASCSGGAAASCGRRCCGDPTQPLPPSGGTRQPPKPSAAPRALPSFPFLPPARHGWFRSPGALALPKSLNFTPKTQPEESPPIF